MEYSFGDSIYSIRSYLWNDLSIKSKKGLEELTKSSSDNAKAFVSLYFNKFDLIHKIGHIIRIELDSDHQKIEKKIEEEYLANLFAAKYFQFKNEEVYLKDLERWIDFLLRQYNINHEINVLEINDGYAKYTEDIRTYAAISFVMIKQCLKNAKSFDEIVNVMSKGKIASINKSIITRKGINGIALMDECKEIMFNLYESVVDIKLIYESELDIKNIEKIEIDRRAAAPA